VCCGDVQATPKFAFQLEASESSKQVCVKSTGQVSVKSSTNLNINIPWANIKEDKTWSADVYESGVLPIADKCLPL
jgi:hypothetical protein